MKSFKKLGAFAAVCLLAAMLASAGCTLLEGRKDENAPQDPESITFTGYEEVLEIPVGEGENSIGYEFDDNGNVGIAQLRAVSDDEFILVDTLDPKLIFVGKEGVSRVISLQGICSKPTRVAYDNGKIAVLDGKQVVFLNDEGEVLKTTAIPKFLHEGYFGAEVFEFIEGKLTVQLYSDYAYELDVDSFKELPAFLSVVPAAHATEVRYRGTAWKVKMEQPPVDPVVIHGNKLLAMTYGAPDDDLGIYAGLYYAGINKDAVAPIDAADLISTPIATHLSMSPSDRVYMLQLHEDRAVIVELIFKEIN